ncbi:MAG: hypothetical protein ACUVR0_07180 [Candidatus Aminicenantales bacterium]
MAGTECLGPLGEKIFLSTGGKVILFFGSKSTLRNDVTFPESKFFCGLGSVPWLQRKAWVKKNKNPIEVNRNNLLFNLFNMIASNY